MERDELERSVHDNKMPQGWHTIKSVLLKEIKTAANFHLCMEAADALFHARLIGEGIAREFGTKLSDNSIVGSVSEATNDKWPA